MKQNQYPPQSPERIPSNEQSYQEPLPKVLAFPDGSRVVSHEQYGDVVEHPLLDANGNPSELLVYTASGSTYYFQPHEDGLSWGALLRTTSDGHRKKYELYGNETLRVTIGEPMELPSSKIRQTTRIAGVLTPVAPYSPQFESAPDDVTSSANPFDAMRKVMSEIEPQSNGALN